MSSSASSEEVWWAIGSVVEVERRCWAGMNRPGGVGRITKIFWNAEEGELCNVKYVLGGSDRNVPKQFVSSNSSPEKRSPVARVRFTVGQGEQQRKTAGNPKTKRGESAKRRRRPGASSSRALQELGLNHQDSQPIQMEDEDQKMETRDGDEPSEVLEKTNLDFSETRNAPRSSVDGEERSRFQAAISRAFRDGMCEIMALTELEETISRALGGQLTPSILRKELQVMSDENKLMVHGDTVYWI